MVTDDILQTEQIDLVTEDFSVSISDMAAYAKSQKDSYIAFLQYAMSSSSMAISEIDIDVFS